MKAEVHYLLRLGDTALITGQRMSEWCGHGPILEEDIALTNIALDHIGQSRLLLTEAGEREGENRTEDHLAYRREVGEFRNLLIAELPNGDFGVTILRLLFTSAFQWVQYQSLLDSPDAFLASFAEKSLKEVRYHFKHARDWTLRLGDGTTESHKRAQAALDQLWAYTGEFFTDDAVEDELSDKGLIATNASLEAEWMNMVSAVLSEATLTLPEEPRHQKGGKQGAHSEHMGFLLAEMQTLARAYPDAEW